MSGERWITVGMAARRAGYSEDYFRRVFCDRKAPHPLLVIRSSKGPRGGRRILISLASTEAFIESEIERSDQPALFRDNP